MPLSLIGGTAASALQFGLRGSIGRARMPPRPNSALPTSDEVQHQSDHRDDEQKVNQPTGNVEREKTQQPQNQQNKKQRQKQ